MSLLSIAETYLFILLNYPVNYSNFPICLTMEGSAVWISHVVGTIEVCSSSASLFGVEFMFVYPPPHWLLLICNLNC